MIPSRRNRPSECYSQVAFREVIKKWNYLETKELAAMAHRGAAQTKAPVLISGTEGAFVDFPGE